MKKISNLYNKISSKSELFEPIFVIGASLIIVFGIMASVQGVFGQTVTTIVNNRGEELYYEAKYDDAIIEYTNLQEKEQWPIWKVKIAEVYSIKGEFEKSNGLLTEAMLGRNKFMAEGEIAYSDNDNELLNEVVFTFFMNKNSEEAISLGEDYISNGGNYKPLLRTMFSIYVVNNDINKAKNIIDTYEADVESAYDLAIFAKMQMMLNDYEKGFNTLKQAWDIDCNEIKIFDVIAQMSEYGGTEFVECLKGLVAKDSEQSAYKLWLAKVYSLEENTVNLAEDLLKSVADLEELSINYQLVKADVYKLTDRKAEANNIIEGIIANKDSGYIGYNLAAWQALENRQYDKALEFAKKSILANDDYADNYGILIPRIMIESGKTELAEPYLRTALAKEPFNYNIIVNIANYYAKGAVQYDKAIGYYKLALSLILDKNELYYNIGMLEIAKENYQEAEKSLLKAIELNENNGDYYRSLGTVYINLEETEKAIELYRKAYSLNENDLLTLSNAACYYIQEEHDIYRGYENIKSAFDELSLVKDESNKKILIDNYNKAKELFDKYVNDNEAELTIPEFNYFY